MLIIQRLTICNFHFLLSIDKTKENNQHNKSLNKDKMMLDLYSTISLSNITKAFMVTLHSNIKTYGRTLLELTLKISKFKEKTKKRKKETECFPAKDRTSVANVIDQQDIHYTTRTADSISEINYLYTVCIRAYYGRLALSKVVIALNDALQDTALKTPILILGSYRFGYFPNFQRGSRWLSGRVSDSGARGPGFETYRRRVVSLSKTLYSPKVLVNYPGSDGSVPT